MPKKQCFCVYDRAGSDISQMDKNQAKTNKQARDLEKCQKTEPGMEFSSIHLKNAQMVIQDSQLVNNGPWIRL